MEDDRVPSLRFGINFNSEKELRVPLRDQLPKDTKSWCRAHCAQEAPRLARLLLSGLDPTDAAVHGVDQQGDAFAAVRWQD